MTPRVDPSSLLTGTAERPALLFRDGSLSYAQLRRAAGGLATELEALGPGRSLEGAPVAVVAPNAPAIVAAMLAVWEAGAVAVPLSARLREFELERILRDVDPAAIVSPASHGGYSFDSLWSRLAPELPALRGCLLVDEWGGVQERVPARPEADVKPLRPATPQRSSTPRAAPARRRGRVVTHACLLAEARVLPELLGLSEGEASALVIPASHAFGLACLLASLASERPRGAGRQHPSRSTRCSRPWRPPRPASSTARPRSSPGCSRPVPTASRGFARDSWAERPARRS